MTPSRALLAGSGIALAVSLFVEWFDGVSGWEHWAWADVVLIVLAADLVAAASTPPNVVHRVLVAVFCGLGVAVVLGHGFEPRVEVAEGSVHGGPYLALVALCTGAIAALAPWPRRGGAVLLVVAAAGLVASLGSSWGGAGYLTVLVGDEVVGRVTDYPNGFERWHALDVGMLVLAAGLVAAATGRVPRVLCGLLAAAAVAVAACVLAASDTQIWVGDGGIAEGAAMGGLGALLSVIAALSGLAFVTRRERSERAG